MSLTPKQIKNYENNGYICPIDVLSKKEAHEIREEIELIESHKLESLQKIFWRNSSIDFSSISSVSNFL